MTTRIFTDKECRAIARVYDGTTETLNALLKRYRSKQVRRHNIYHAARRGGYKPAKERIVWTPENDQYLRDHWGKLPPQEIYATLKCSPSSVFNRLKRIGHSTRDNTDFTVYDIEHLTKLDHRLLRRFIDEGWLKAYNEYGRNGEVWSRRVRLAALHEFLRAHPEAFDYRAVPRDVKAALELHRLPAPPQFKRLTCRSDNWQDGVKATPTGFHVHHGEVQLRQAFHRHHLKSCASLGGTDTWAPIYAVSTNCPRCGCLLSRFSEKAIFSDEDPGEDDTLNAIAGKLGLSWRNGAFYNGRGQVVDEAELLRFVFSTKRQPGKAFSTFRRLLQAGVTLTPPNPVPAAAVLPNILDYRLRPKQANVFEAFQASGNIGVYWPPGIGKMFLLAMIYTRLAGLHFLFVHSRTIRDQWIEFFRQHAPRVKVASHGGNKSYYRVDIYDRQDVLRCTVRIYGYRIRNAITDVRPVVIGYDEAQFLPGNNASQTALLKSDYRVGLTATPFREDGRADLIQVMTGDPHGADWAEFKDAGEVADVPVRVVIVKDREQKFRALRRALTKRRTIVFSDAIEDGKLIEQQLRIPFIYSETENRLQVLRDNRSVCMSRVGDCGLDVTDLQEVIEFNFFFGSRSQSLQRLGRLLHSRRPVRHTVLMTIKEFSLHHKRLTAMEQKGFRLHLMMYRDVGKVGRPPAPKPVSAWAQLMGITPAPKALSPFTESNEQKHLRVIRRIDKRIEARAA